MQTEDGSVVQGIDKAGFSGVRWFYLLGLIGPINLLMSLDRQAMTLAAPKLQHLFDLSFVQMSIVVTCAVWAYALLQIPAGALVNHFGPRRVLFFGCFLWSVATLLTPWGIGLYSFIAIRMLMGSAQAPDWSASIVSIDNWFHDRERSKANSTLLGFLYLGTVIGGPLTTTLATYFSWKFSFYMYGTAGLVVSVLWLRLFRDRPHTVVTSTASAVPLPRQPAVFRKLLSSSQFWAVGLHYLCVLTMQSFFLVVMPFYLMNGRHIGYLSMGWLYGLPWFAMYISVFVSGYVADTIRRRTRSVWMACTPMGVIGTLMTAVLLGVGSHIENITVMIAFFCASLGFMGLSQVSIWTSVQDLTKHHTGIVAGWTTCLGNAASGLAPIAMAFIEHKTGSWSLALSLPMMAGVVGAFCCTLTHPERTIEI